MSEARLPPLDTLVSRRSAARLRAFRRSVERAAPGLVADMLLFGSRARGEGQKHSDYDVAIVIKGPHRPIGLRALLSDAAYPHLLAGVSIRPLIVLAKDIKQDSMVPVTRNISRDGIVIP